MAVSVRIRLGTVKIVADAVEQTTSRITVSVPVILTNAGSVTWDPAQKFDLAYHVFDLAGGIVVWDGARTLLPAPVAPGASVTVNATVALPTTPGTFALKFDLVQEGVSWFSGQGVPAESITVTVQ